MSSRRILINLCERQYLETYVNALLVDLVRQQFMWVEPSSARWPEKWSEKREAWKMENLSYRIEDMCGERYEPHRVFQVFKCIWVNGGRKLPEQLQMRVAREFLT